MARKSRKNPEWNLDLKETALVAAVGAGLTWAAAKLTDEPVDPTMLAAGSALYVIGVVAGTNRASWPQIG